MGVEAPIPYDAQVRTTPFQQPTEVVLKPSHRVRVVPVPLVVPVLPAVVFALCAALCGNAAAQDASRLGKTEVEALTADKELKYERADGSTVAWDFRKDGSVYYTPRNAKRAVVIGGTYAVDDDGALCLKWREDKYVTMTDGCYVFTRLDDKTRISSRRNPERIVGTLQ